LPTAAPLASRSSERRHFWLIRKRRAKR
jgi:hypothetical protein